MKECKEFLIFGRVQGVGFRRFVKAKVDFINQSQELIVGNVCNLDDGSVRVVAQGQKEVLQKLEKFLEAGSITSKVENIQSKSLDINQALQGFEILE